MQSELQTVIFGHKYSSNNEKKCKGIQISTIHDDLHAILSPFESLATSVSVKSGILASSLSWTILLKHSLGLLWKNSLPARMRKDFLEFQSHSSCRFMLSFTTKAYLERNRHLQDTRVAKSAPFLFNNSRATQLSTLFWVTGKKERQTRRDSESDHAPRTLKDT